MVSNEDRQIALALAGEQAEIREISVQDCFIDIAYGRIPKEKDLQKFLGGRWSWLQFEVPLVSERPDGKYAVLDGGHRTVALREVHGDDAKFKAQVVSGLDEETEAWLFEHLDTDRTRQTPAQIFISQLTSKTREAVDIYQVCQIEKVMIWGVDGPVPSRGQMRERGTHAIKTLRAIYRAGGRRHLRKVLETIGGAWRLEYGAYDRFPLRAVSNFWLAHPQAKEDRLIKILGMRTPNDLHIGAQSLQGALRVGANVGTIGVWGQRILAEWYNLGLSAKANNRLEVR